MKSRYLRTLAIDRLEARRCMTAAFLERTLDGLPRDETSNYIALGDLDRDGDQDLVIGIEFWRENLDGTGRFGDPQRFAPRDATNHSLAEVQVADVDSDGDQDIVARLAPSRLVWFENRNGLGRFAPRRTLFETGQSLGDFDFADLDGDGRNELVLAVTEPNRGFIKVYERSEKDAVLRATQAFPTNDYSFEVVDWDSDGDLDLFTGSGVRYNLGQNAWSAPLGPAPVGKFILGDLDGDNSPDVVSYFHGFQWIRDGIATTLDVPDIESPSHAQGVDLISISDVDGDRDGDLIVRLYLMDFYFDQLLVNQGNSFSGPLTLKSAVGGSPFFDRFEDVNGDGKAEGVSATRVYEPTSSPVKILYGRDAASPYGQDLADVDADGDLDLLSHSYTICGPHSSSCNIQFHWNENLDGLDSFGATRLIAPFPDSLMENIPPVPLIDVDNDGDLDALTLATRGATSLSWVKNVDGRGAFLQQLISLDVPSDYLRAEPRDVDGDGDTDLVLKENWVENLSGRGFAPAKSMIGVSSPDHIAWHDWDADGDLDLITYRRSTVDGSRYLDFNERIGINPPQFAPPVEIPSSPPTEYMNLRTFLLIDVDTDGDNDVIHSDFRERHYLQKNDGGQLGSWERVFAEMSKLSELEPIDLDGDHDLDLLSSHGSWLENVDGKGQWSQQRLPTNDWSDVGDMDGDGDQDILSFSGWLENRSVGDINGDGRFNSSDLVAVCAAGLFEYEVEGIADFLTGDWNGDKKFDSADWMFAFQFGKYTVD